MVQNTRPPPQRSITPSLELERSVEDKPLEDKQWDATAAIDQWLQSAPAQDPYASATSRLAQRCRLLEANPELFDAETIVVKAVWDAYASSHWSSVTRQLQHDLRQGQVSSTGSLMDKLPLTPQLDIPASVLQLAKSLENSIENLWLSDDDMEWSITTTHEPLNEEPAIRAVLPQWMAVPSSHKDLISIATRFVASCARQAALAARTDQAEANTPKRTVCAADPPHAIIQYWDHRALERIDGEARRSCSKDLWEEASTAPLAHLRPMVYVTATSTGSTSTTIWLTAPYPETRPDVQKVPSWRTALQALFSAPRRTSSTGPK